MSARSSDSIRHIAKALAAAQLDLKNPEARHDGQIRRELPSGLALIEPYRFASLGDGLTLIRPALGGHGLSLIQATRIDGQAGLLVLETRIIHESGEWILADYPVGPLPASGPSDPRDLGAALTYARRQSLFSLIGIAPQTDTDGRAHAECLPRPPNASPQAADSAGEQGLRASEAAAPCHGQAWPGEGDRAFSGGPGAATGQGLRPPSPREAGLTPEDMVRALMGELEGLSSLAELRSWAIERVKAMAKLMPQDRRRLNEAFLAKRNLAEQQRSIEDDNGKRASDRAGISSEPSPGTGERKGTELSAAVPVHGMKRQRPANSQRARPVSTPKAAAGGGALP